MRWLLSSLILGSFQLVSATLQIVPGATWIASGTNQHVQAHGGGIIKEGDTYYWIGEDKTGGWPYYGINCYSSKNLVEWAFVRALFTRQSKGAVFGPNRIVERPKVIYNSVTEQYVMWMHIDDYPEYNEAKVGVATSSSVCGDYTYQDDFRPGGLDSRDFTVFQDTDGKAYLVTEQRADGTAIYQLSDDYMSIGPRVFKWDEKHESPAMIKTSSGVYFLFVSGLTYWKPNDNFYSTSTSISGPWSPFQKFAPDGSNTFDSQTSFVLPLGNDKFMYMGDRWDGPDRWWMSDHLFRSTYVWLPLEISGITASMQNNYASWTLDVGSGSMALVSTKGYEAENALMSGSAKRVDCEGCSGKGAVGYIGGSGNGTLTFNITSDTDVRTTLRIEAPNGDRRVRNTTVTTNGAVQVIPVLPSNNGNVPGPVALHVDLKRGGNTIMISGFGSENAVDIDVIVVST